MPSLNTLVVVADCLRADAVPGEFCEGAVYANAWSCGSATIPAFASLYTGLLPHQHGQSDQAHRQGWWHVPTEDAPRLPSRMPQHNALVVTENPFIEWAGHFIPAEHGGGEGVKYILENCPSSPWLIVYHCMITHWPYGGAGHEHVQIYKGAEAQGLSTMRELYAGGVARLMTALAELEDRLEPDVTIVTADHGEGMMEHGFYGHPCDRMWPELLHVPLIVRDGKRKYTYTHPFSMVHFPSVVEAASRGKRVTAPAGEVCYSAGYRPYGGIASVRCDSVLVIRSDIAEPVQYDLGMDRWAQTPSREIGPWMPELHTPVYGPLATKKDADEQAVMERLRALGYA